MGSDMWARRYREINNWERFLVDNGIKIVKIFLNLSKEEQRVRLLRRLDLPDHRWKFSASDVAERGRWDDYQMAYSEMLSNTSTSWAPWYVVPADRKWFARICASAILTQTLMELDPQYPVVSKERERDLLEIKASLEAEAPRGTTPVPSECEQATDPD
jgi:polyphosphate kinase 2 (PPK2 family)